MTTDSYSSSTDRFNAVTLQSGKIVAAGYTSEYGGAAAVIRYTQWQPRQPAGMPSR